MANIVREPVGVMSAKRLEVARLRATGMSVKEASEVSGVGKSTISRWELDPLYLDKREEYCKELLGDLVRKAVSVLGDQLEYQDGKVGGEWLRQNAAARIIQIAQSNEQRGGTAVSVYFGVKDEPGMPAPVPDDVVEAEYEVSE